MTGSLRYSHVLSEAGDSGCLIPVHPNGGLRVPRHLYRLCRRPVRDVGTFLPHHNGSPRRRILRKSGATVLVSCCPSCEGGRSHKFGSRFVLLSQTSSFAGLVRFFLSDHFDLCLRKGPRPVSRARYSTRVQKHSHQNLR